MCCWYTARPTQSGFEPIHVLRDSNGRAGCLHLGAPSRRIPPYRESSAAGSEPVAPNTPPTCEGHEHPDCSEISGRDKRPDAGCHSLGLALAFFSSSSTRFFSLRSSWNTCGSLGRDVAARSHSLAANAGEPEIRAPAGTSPPIPL